MSESKVKFPLATKLSLTYSVLIAASVAAIFFAVRGVVVEQFTRRYEVQLIEESAVVQLEIERRNEALRKTLKEMAARLQGDARFRMIAVINRDFTNPYLIEYAATYMQSMGLDFLQIVNDRGTVLSSGRNPDEFGKNAASLLRRISAPGDSALCGLFLTEKGWKISLAAGVPMSSGGRRFHIIGAQALEDPSWTKMARTLGGDLLIQLPDTAITLGSGLGADTVHSAAADSTEVPVGADIAQRTFSIPMIGRGAAGRAHFILRQRRTELTELLKVVNDRLLLISGIGILTAILLSIWRARSIVRPLHRLSVQAAALSLENLDVQFDQERKDEAGVLGRALSRMVAGLRSSRMELARAEQKAARGELARQVTHDLKNGIIPIRNIMKHWREVAEEDPGALTEVFKERHQTVQESLGYLEELARSYRRMQGELNPQHFDVHKLIASVVEQYRGMPKTSIAFELDLGASGAGVYADRTQLRRAFDNLLRNAMEALEAGGRVVISTADEGGGLRITFADDGPGMPADLQQKLFSGPVTTRPDGSGIGLPNVKRIVEDAGGRLKIESAEGRGTAVSLLLPHAGEQTAHPAAQNNEKRA